MDDAKATNLYFSIHKSCKCEWVGGRNGCATGQEQSSLKRPLVQILVVVANIQMRTLKTEVEKGSMWTAFGHGLVGPKVHGNPNDCLPKGNQVNIPELTIELYGNTTCDRDIFLRPRKSYLFFLTCSTTLESIHSAIGSLDGKNGSISESFCAREMVLENLSQMFVVIRTHNRIRSPRWVASSW
jgi:hypothetical protein